MATSAGPRPGPRQRLGSLLLADGRLTRRELPAAAAALLVLAALALGPRTSNANFSNDDWAYLIGQRYPEPEGLLATFEFLSFRPLLQAWLPAEFTLLGADPAWHLALLAVICAVEALMVFAIVRRLGGARLLALAVAGLVLILPLRDATRFWVCLGPNVFAVVLWLGGVLTALSAFRRTGRRAALLHVAAGVLYLLSLALYEIAAAPMLAALGLLVLRERRRALLPCGAQAVAAGLWLALVSSGSFYEPLTGRDLRFHGEIVLREIPWALADVVWAPGAPSKALAVLVCLALAAVLGGSAALLRLGRLAASAEPLVRRWLGIAACAAVVAAAGWATMAPTEFFNPLAPGQFNRGNIIAGPAAVLLVVAAVVIAAALLLGRAARLVPAVAAVPLVVIGLGYTVELRSDLRDWNFAGAEQRRIVGVVTAQVPPPAPGTTIIASGFLDFLRPGVQIFAAPWDLDGALSVHWDQPELQAYVAVPGSRVVCGRRQVVLKSRNDVFGFDPQSGVYGRTWFVDVAAGTARRIDGRRACERAEALARS